MTEPDWKPYPRIVEPTITRKALLFYPRSIVSGEVAHTGHHVLPRGGFSGLPRGDDVIANVVGLTGSGTTGEHGRAHAADPVVLKLIGEGIRRERPDTIAYLRWRLGDVAAVDYLRRAYLVDVELTEETEGWRP